MPHVRDTRAVSPDHDLHDRFLVAALAAGDLAATDRDHALSLTGSCAACTELHDDLLAIARATASVPPISARPRDFQLTPADAARLHPTGLRAVLARLVAAPRGVTRPLGAGLATIGLVGLLIGNAPVFTFGSAASVGTGASAGGAAAENAGAPSAAPASGALAPVAIGPQPAPSGAYVTEASAAASATLPGSDANGAPSASAAAQATDASGGSRSSTDQLAAGPVTTGSKAAASATRDLLPTAVAPADGPLRPANVLFASAVLVGVGLLILSRRRGRDPA